MAQRTVKLEPAKMRHLIGLRERAMRAQADLQACIEFALLGRLPPGLVVEGVTLDTDGLVIEVEDGGPEIVREG